MSLPTDSCCAKITVKPTVAAVAVTASQVRVHVAAIPAKVGIKAAPSGKIGVVATPAKVAVSAVPTKVTVRPANFPSGGSGAQEVFVQQTEPVQGATPWLLAQTDADGDVEFLKVYQP